MSAPVDPSLALERLRGLFTSEELRHVLRYRPGGVDLVDALPSPGVVSHAQFVGAVVEVLERRGRLTETFLEELVAARSAWTGSRLLDPLFKPLRKYVGVDGYLPSQLLRPEHAIVPFMGSADKVQDLLDWSKGGGARVRVVHGPGGAGKTRLALEVAARLGEGWRAGPIVWDRLNPEALDELFRDPSPLFLILDYAETRPAELVQVLRRLADHSEANARVLLLARGIGDWWTRASAEVPELEGLAWGVPPIRVEVAEDGAAHAQKAAEAFAGWLAVDPPRTVTDRGRTALERQVEALVAVLGGDAKGIDGLLRHEDAYVQRAAKAADIPTPVARLLQKAMALVTLAGGVSGAEAGDWLALVGGLHDLRGAEGASVAELLSSLYPRTEGGIDSVRPDRIGEVLVAREDREGKLAEAAVDRGRGKAALTVLTRLGAVGNEEPLRRVIEARREVLVEAVIEVAHETGDPVGRVMAESLEAQPEHRLAHDVVKSLPLRSLTLRQLAVVAGRQAANGTEDDEARVWLLNNLAGDLGCSGRGDEALVAIVEAVRAARRLVSSHSTAFLPELAATLRNLSGALSTGGRPEEALVAAEEALETTRRLVASGEASSLDVPDSLSVLSRRLADLGRNEQALEAMEEAVASYRQTAVEYTDDGLPIELGLALNDYSTQLDRAGKRDQALAASEESVAILRGLAEAEPDAFLPDLTRALVNFSMRLGDHGRRQEALKAIEEVVVIRRRLAIADPEAFLPDLAGSLAVRAWVQTSLDPRAAVDSAAESLRMFVQSGRRRTGAHTRRYRTAQQVYRHACSAAAIPPDPALLE